MIKKSLVNTGVQILGKMVMVGISLITTGVLTRKLGVSSYGNFILISSVFVFLDSLADFGTKTIGVREVSRENGEKKLSQIFNLRILMTSLAFTIGMLVIWNWSGLGEIKFEATLALLMIFLTSMAGFWEIIFQSKLRMDLKVLMDISFPLIFLTWLWWWKGSVDLILVFGVYLVARLVSLGIGYYLVLGISKIEFRGIEWAELKNLWQLTWPMGLFLMMFATYDRAIDSLLIRHYLGTNEVAWYGLSYKIYAVLLAPAYFYVNSIFPLMGAKMTNKKKLFSESVIVLMVAAIAVVVGINIMAPWMVNVLGGNEFWPSIEVLRVLVWAALFSYMGHLIGFTLISLGGQKEMLKLGIIALLVNLTLNVIYIPSYGIMAAAKVTVFTEFLDCLLMAWYLWEKVKFCKAE